MPDTTNGRVMDRPEPGRLATLLAATAVGAYLLLIAGAAASVTEAAAACGGWPGCDGGLALPASSDGWVAIVHRIGAVAVGGLLAYSALEAWRGGADRRVLAGLGVAGLLYPAQAAVGAVVAAVGTTAAISAFHLGGGIVIFLSTLAALGWQLEAETGTPDEEPPGTPERDLPPVGTVDRPELPADPLPRAKLTLAAYFRLTKPRLMWLLCLVAAAAMALAGGRGVAPATVGATLGGGVLAIGAAGTFNHVLERDVDRRMERTSDRPLATEVVPVRNAVAFGLALAAGALALFAWVNLTTAALGLAAILFYSVVYTLLLKPNTVQNTVIGGAAGALPALIGWAAVTGGIGLGGVLLASLVFVWTPAHFYNLALAYREDYERGGFPMLPVVRGETTTRRHIVWYLGATLVVAAVLAAATELGVAFGFASLLLGGGFLWTVVLLHYERTERAALRSFHASNAYLGCALVAVLLDSLVV